MEECLLICTKDKRHFLTYKRFLNNLIEFSKAFHVNIYLAKPLPGANVLTLKDFCTAICDPLHNEETGTFERLQKVFPVTSPSVKIKDHISKRLLAGKSVSMKHLQETYVDCSRSTLYNCFNEARKMIARDGYKLKKLGVGTYCLTN